MIHFLGAAAVSYLAYWAIRQFVLGMSAGLNERAWTQRQHDARAWTPPNEQMSPKGARELLGLDRGASELEIREAHRRLIRALLPDAGGTPYLAAKVNAAKDILLKARRG